MGSRVSEQKQGQVRRYAADSYVKWCRDASDYIREHIRKQGYSAKDLHSRLPSIRAGVLEDFVEHKGEYAPRRLVSIAESAGLELEPPRFRHRPSFAPRRAPDAPRKVWG